MSDGLEVDYASLHSYARGLPRSGVASLATVPQGTGAYGFIVLAAAVQAMTTALQGRLDELEKEIDSAQRGLGATVRAYEAVDDGVANGLTGPGGTPGTPTRPRFPLSATGPA